MMSTDVVWPKFSCYTVRRTMPKKEQTNDAGTINIRDIPRDLLIRMKMAAALERRTLKGFLLALAEERIQELEKKGLLPKGK